MKELDNQLVARYESAAFALGERNDFFAGLPAELASSLSSQDNAPEYIMRKLDHERRSRILGMETREELETTYLDLDMVAYLREVYWGGVDKHVLGRSISELVELGFLIPERMIHETMHDEIAKVAAEDLKDVVGSLGIGGINPKLLELNTGMGSLLHRLRGEEFNVIASVDRNHEILKSTRDIWQRLSINGVSFIEADAMYFIKEEIGTGLFDCEDLTVITADPPWEKYMTNDNGDYDFTMFSPDGRVIIDELIKHAPVVAMKLPGNFDLDQLRDFSSDMGVGVHFYSYDMVVGNRTVREGMAIFVRGNVNGNVKWVNVEKTVVYNG